MTVPVALALTALVFALLALLSHRARRNALTIEDLNTNTGLTGCAAFIAFVLILTAIWEAVIA